jgi:hypothetical protein
MEQTTVTAYPCYGIPFGFVGSFLQKIPLMSIAVNIPEYMDTLRDQDTQNQYIIRKCLNKWIVANEIKKLNV